MSAVDTKLEDSDSLQQQSSRARLWQLVVLIICVSLFALQKSEFTLAAVYGGLVSMFIAWTLNWSAIKANEVSKQSPEQGMAVLYMGAAMRFFLILILFAVGLGLLGLQPAPLVVTAVLVWIVGLVAPHFGKTKPSA